MARYVIEAERDDGSKEKTAFYCETIALNVFRFFKNNPKYTKVVISIVEE